MIRKAVRKFGIELEGYMNENLAGKDFTFGSNIFSIKTDGSVRNQTTFTPCEACEGAGGWENPCGNGSCDHGRVCLTDADNNEYRCQCGTCHGAGLVYKRCEPCNGAGGFNHGFWGLEVISPPIRDLDLIDNVFAKMHEYEWKVDNYAGLHIHVDAGDLEPKDFYKVLMLMTAVERVIYSVNDEFRYDTSQYALPLSHFSKSVRNVLHRGIDRVETQEDVKFTNERYSALNFKAFSKHGTIEFRHFSPQTEASKVANFVELVTRLVDFAKYASYEQAYVVYEKIANAENLDVAIAVLKEVLDLPFDLADMYECDAFEDMNRVEYTPQTLLPLRPMVNRTSNPLNLSDEIISWSRFTSAV